MPWTRSCKKRPQRASHTHTLSCVVRNVGTVTDWVPVPRCRLKPLPCPEGLQEAVAPLPCSEGLPEAVASLACLKLLTETGALLPCPGELTESVTQSSCPEEPPMPTDASSRPSGGSVGCPVRRIDWKLPPGRPAQRPPQRLQLSVPCPGELPNAAPMPP